MEAQKNCVKHRAQRIAVEREGLSHMKKVATATVASTKELSHANVGEKQVNDIDLKPGKAADRMLKTATSRSSSTTPVRVARPGSEMCISTGNCENKLQKDKATNYGMSCDNREHFQYRSTKLMTTVGICC